jgi:hypothetical protein
MYAYDRSDSFRIIEDEQGAHRFVIWTITHPEKAA